MIEIDGYLFLAEDVLRSQRIRFQKLIIRSVEHHFPAEISSARPYFNDPVGCFDEFFVMLYDDDGVAHLSQFLDSGDRSDDLFVVESDRRFIEHIDDSGQLVSQLFR